MVKITKDNWLENKKKEFEEEFVQSGKVRVSYNFIIHTRVGVIWSFIASTIKEMEQKTIKRGQAEFKYYLKLHKEDIKEAREQGRKDILKQMIEAIEHPTPQYATDSEGDELLWKEKDRNPKKKLKKEKS